MHSVSSTAVIQQGPCKAVVVNVGLRRQSAASTWPVVIELSVLSLVCVKCGLHPMGQRRQLNHCVL